LVEELLSTVFTVKENCTKATGREDCTVDIISGSLKLGPVRTLDTTYLHTGMILSTLGLSPHGFAFGLTPKGLIPMEIFVHPHIPMILSTSNQCGTLFIYPTGP